MSQLRLEFCSSIVRGLQGKLHRYHFSTTRQLQSAARITVLEVPDDGRWMSLERRPCRSDTCHCIPLRATCAFQPGSSMCCRSYLAKIHGQACCSLARSSHLAVPASLFSEHPQIWQLKLSAAACALLKEV
ncbi:unnamed protein product [Effrenium voratum]|uniref:Uncharacterized protein n=1 Tax=Effrenium voratum TaxID=2562239 RepID=A0AA36IV20_9DINO|nr:unnamed protein product [Effrenium voratum]CAJ1428881.1 unnamed protein product [Effrenium voratum]